MTVPLADIVPGQILGRHFISPTIDTSYYRVVNIWGLNVEYEFYCLGMWVSCHPIPLILITEPSVWDWYIVSPGDFDAYVVHSS